jgi:hypothetical protein
MTDNTGYRITSPDGWVIEASNETQHRRVLVALACLSDVLARQTTTPVDVWLDAAQTATPVVLSAGGFDMAPGHDGRVAPNSARQLPPVDTQALQKLWARLIGASESEGASGDDDVRDDAGPHSTGDVGNGRCH